MPPIVFLTPVQALPADVINLAAKCKTALLSYLFVRIVEEDLRPSADNKTFTAKHPNWLDLPLPKITTINSLGVETLRMPAEYTTSLPGGSIAFPSAITDLVRADYNYFPFSDSQLQDMTLFTLQEISVQIYRPINENNIPADYRMVICKRLYTNLLKTLMGEARDYFSVSVGGRTISKTNVINQITTIIDENEKQVLEDINMLRNFNKTNRLLPSFTTTKTITSSSLVI